MNPEIPCCEQMRSALEDPDIPLTYARKFREIGIRILDGGESYLLLGYCPWCGHKLPDSLRDRWFEELERLHIDPEGDSIPAKYLDETWYTTR